MAATARIARSVFAERYSLADWRVIGRSLVADFRAPTFAAAVEFVGDVGGAADTAERFGEIPRSLPIPRDELLKRRVWSPLLHREVIERNRWTNDRPRVVGYRLHHQPHTNGVGFFKDERRRSSYGVSHG
jgi:hypothetical protein